MTHDIQWSKAFSFLCTKTIYRVNSWSEDEEELLNKKMKEKKKEYQSSRKRYVFLNTSPVSDFPDIVHQYYLSLRVKMINILTRQPIKQSYWLTNSIYPRHETKINQQIDSIVNDLQVKYWLCPEICIPQNPDHNS